MSTAITTQSESALVTPSEARGFLIVESFKQAIEVAEYINKSALVPEAYRGKPADIVIAMQYGMELGLSPLQALQSVAVINGKPSIYGDAVPAIVIGLPECEDIIEVEPTGDIPEQWVASCTVKRRGKEPKTRAFSWADAKKAGLAGKSGPWSNYPKRMLLMRARGFAIRDAFPDRMKGMILAEEAEDYPTPKPAPSEPRRVGESATPAASAQPTSTTPPASAVASMDAAKPAPTAPPAAASVSASTTGVQLTTGVKIDDTKVAVDPKTKQTTYEVYAKKGNAVVGFLTHDKALYNEAASCEGTDHLFTITYTRGRHHDKPALIMTGITIEERDDETPQAQQPELPTGEGNGNA